MYETKKFKDFSKNKCTGKNISMGREENNFNTIQSNLGKILM